MRQAGISGRQLAGRLQAGRRQAGGKQAADRGAAGSIHYTAYAACAKFHSAYSPYLQSLLRIFPKFALADPLK